jgi:hypothetical protein
LVEELVNNNQFVTLWQEYCYFTKSKIGRVRSFLKLIAYYQFNFKKPQEKHTSRAGNGY